MDFSFDWLGAQLAGAQSVYDQARTFGGSDQNQTLTTVERPNNTGAVPNEIKPAPAATASLEKKDNTLLYVGAAAAVVVGLVLIVVVAK